jgi:hypothetical protein
MFRRFLVLTIAALAAVGAAWSLPAQAAPVSGSATLDIVFYPKAAVKISEPWVKLELDAVLTLSVSGVDITSVSVFTFRGLETQSFTATGTVGALTFRNQFIFAPNIIEIEEVRTTLGLVGYCVNFADPAMPHDNTLTTGLPQCGSHTDSGALGFWATIEFYDALSNLTLASIMQLNGHLSPPLSFRKKVVDLSLNIAGLTIGLRGMFANIGSTTTPAWSTGVVASVEGQTVSGITIRGETWIGAKQGLECFGECKPLQIVRGGKVIRNFVVTEEKLFIRNLKIAGVTFGARMEFSFEPSVGVGLAYLELSQDFTLAPFGLTVNNLLRFMGPNLTIVANQITTSLRIGEMSATVRAFIYPSLTSGAYTVYFSDLITTFDPPGVKFTSHIRMCNDENTCAWPDGIIFHDLSLSTAVGDATIDILLEFAGLLRDFSFGFVGVSWQFGNVTFTSETYLDVDALLAQKFSIGVTF